MPNQCAEIANRGKILISTEDAAQIVRLMRTLIQADGPLSSMLSDLESLNQFETSGGIEDNDELRMVARKMYIRRQARRRHFPTGYFHEPAWDMLLALYVGCDVKCGPPVSSLLTYTETPPTTALRHLALLEHYGHIQRHPCSHDKRMIYVDITATARAAMNRYLGSIVETGNL